MTINCVFLQNLDTNFVSFKNNIQSMLKQPKIIHFFHIFNFFLFNVFLLGFDIYSDIATADNFIRRGHTYWGSCTAFFICLPFLARLLMFIYKLVKCFFMRNEEQNFEKNYTRINVQFQDFPKLIYNVKL